MKAIINNSYGPPDILKLMDVPKPVPSDDELLIRIVAVSLNGSDREGLSGKPFYARIGGLFKPRNPILGSDIAGVVEFAGQDNSEFKIGDEVFGEIPGYHGGLAEYVTTHGKTMALKPAGLSFEEAAAIPQAGVIAFQAICEQGKVDKDQKVLINGAGGSAGSFAIQLANLCGAKVTGVDSSAKLAFMQSLGADHVIDYSQEDFTKGHEKYDLILDVIAHRPMHSYLKALKPNGTLFAVGGSVSVLLQILAFGPLLKKRSGKNVRVLAVPQNRKDLIAITELCQSGNIRPVIDRTYPLAKAVEAISYLSEGQAKGKVVVAIEGSKT